MSSDGAESGGAPPQAPAPSGPGAQPQESPDGGRTDEQRLSSDHERGVNEALFTGDRYYSPKLAPSGPVSNIGHATITEMQVGHRYEFFLSEKAAPEAGPVPEEIIRWVRERYLAVDRYPDMVEMLEKRRLVLLRGQPGTGRTTTALHLLDQFAPARVFRMKCGKNAKSLSTGKLGEKNAGYVAELPSRVGGGLTEEILDELRNRLEKAQSYAVLVAATDPRHVSSFGRYAFDYQAPDPADLLRKHLEHEILPGDPPGFEDELRRLSEARWTGEALGPCPRPSESAWMAALLAKHARGESTRDDVERDAKQAVSHQVSEWFGELLGLAPGAELNEALRLAAFRIALAVLNRSPYTVVAEAAELLSRKFGGEETAKGKQQVSLFADDRSNRLPALRAKTVDGHATFGRELIPMELLEFHDPRYPTAVLDHVWRHHHQLRNALEPWFAELGKDNRPMVWVRAAQATGYLGRLDFVTVFTKMIAPNASSDDWDDFQSSRRRSAAIALDQAARDERVRPAIIERLDQWRRYGTPEHRWTAAATYGFALGRERIFEALEELRVLGTPAERSMPLVPRADEEVVWIAGFSVAKLLAFGKVTEVLDHLRRWLASHRSSLRGLALTSLKHLASFYGFELDYLSVSMENDRPVLPYGAERWPLLLALCAQDADVAARISVLLNKALRSREGDTLARFLLARWVRSSERDPALLDVLADFLTGLVAHDGDARRLQYLLNRLTDDWADPLQPEVAARLRTAVQNGERTRVAA
ncbi:hypothetical protein ABJI51_41520 [Amycolatopsis sp. NEAU-NG30]|uniref:AAA+ ATPase domain-containing protein n=1 Tax=Amycolatopsis melonis TaxID=3156488 RepID=A0ABV0LVT3_9PSEU